jgi:hypothetical protein
LKESLNKKEEQRVALFYRPQFEKFFGGGKWD